MTTRKKIAVIGGGMSALTSVYNIIKTPDWRQKYDITIYQQGWRIGGKGASGRNLSEGKRIEEHGLHIWFGFYANAFNLIKDCYSQLSGKPYVFQSFKDAFKPHSYVPIGEYIDDKWEFWNLNFPTNDLEPGGSHEFLPLSAYVQMALQEIFNFLDRKSKAASENDGFYRIKNKAVSKILSELADYAGNLVEKAVKAGENLSDEEHPDTVEFTSSFHRFNNFLKNIIADLLSHNTKARHIFIVIDLALTTIKGILGDKLLVRGLDAVNDEEYREWLKRHGAANITIESSLVRALYDLVFAYEGGNIDRPNVEAGSSIRVILRLGLAYRGAFMWKMQAGMGDTIFTPIYMLFNQFKPTEEEGGITFKFFHKVTNLGLSEDKKTVKNISVQVQATTRDGREYKPLVIVKDLACWPSTPIYKQLEQGEILQAENINLESSWTPWQGVENKTLECGKDFDTVIIGTPIATLPYICPELIDANPKWRAMVENVKTVQTQAYQIWLNKDLKELGWQNESPVMGCFVEPMDTWADMSQLIDKEDYPTEQEPKNISYYCGVFQDANVIPPPEVHSFPKEENERVKRGFVDYVNNELGWLFPACTTSEHPKGLNPDVLIDLQNREGQARINGQYWRANIDPSERYTLTTTNSSAFRLATDETGFDNVYITGDWVKNTLNFGCIEACVMTGMMTARAITGVDIQIVGEEREPKKQVNYIEYGGNILMQPPYAMKDCSMTGFLFESSGGTQLLQKILDQRLNFASSNSNLKYECVMPYVMLTFANTQKSSSIPQSNMGYMVENEMVAWILAKEQVFRHGKWVDNRLVWFIPYIAVDNIYNNVGGREVFGYPKTLGKLSIPENPRSENPCTISIPAFKVFSPDECLQEYELLSIVRHKEPIIQEIGDAIAFLKELKNFFASKVEKDSFSLRLCVHETMDLLNKIVECVFLKQYRDSASSTGACYQAIVNGNYQINDFKTGAFLGFDNYTLHINDLASYPMRQELGLTNGQRAELAFYLKVDMTALLGKELYKNTN